MGRRYSVPFVAVAVTGAQDLWEIVAATGKPFLLCSFQIGQKTDYGDAAAEGLDIQIKRATGSYTSGSGGSTVTPAKHATNDAAAGPTPEINNTTQAAAGSGTLTTLFADCWNVQAGYTYLPPLEDRYSYLPAEACIISVSAPADSITMSGTAVIEEL